MDPISWAAGKKNDLLGIQNTIGIPAIHSAATFCHEAFNPDGSLSELAEKHNNYGGLKWAPWQEAYGCKPVVYGTWEVLDSEAVEVEDAFCSCPGWTTWLSVFNTVLRFQRYHPAYAFVSMPLLFSYHVWKGGWATDPNYLGKIAEWMAKLHPIFEDTYPRPVWRPVPIEVVGESGQISGVLSPEGKTLVGLRILASTLGCSVDYKDGVVLVQRRK